MSKSKNNQVEATAETPQVPDVPEGYMKNHKGHLIPVEQVTPLDQLRDELVRKLVTGAQEISDKMAAFKFDAMKEIHSFIEVAAQDYDVEIGGAKGNTTLRTYDGLMEVAIRVADRIVFDEKLNIAKELIDQCLHDWTEDSRSELKAIIDLAFNVDQEGKINTSAILQLKRLNISDERWIKAMQAINDSMSTASSKEYLRFYEHDASGKRNMLDLDMSTL